MGRRGAGAQRGGVAAERCIAGAERITGSPERITGRAWQQQAASIGAGDPSAGRGSSRQPIHRQGVASTCQPMPLAGRPAAGSRSPAGRGSIGASDHRQQGGQGLKAAKSSHAKDESPTGILSTHIRVAAEKNFFTPRRGVIWGEKRPFPARGRKPCYDFCVGRESPPAKQKLHSADHGAERISP